MKIQTINIIGIIFTMYRIYAASECAMELHGKIDAMFKRYNIAYNRKDIMPVESIEKTDFSEGCIFICARCSSLMRIASSSHNRLVKNITGYFNSEENLRKESPYDKTYIIENSDKSINDIREMLDTIYKGFLREAEKEENKEFAYVEVRRSTYDINIINFHFVKNGNKKNVEVEEELVDENFKSNQKKVENNIQEEESPIESPIFDFSSTSEKNSKKLEDNIRNRETKGMNIIHLKKKIYHDEKRNKELEYLHLVNPKEDKSVLQYYFFSIEVTNNIKRCVDIFLYGLGTSIIIFIIIVIKKQCSRIMDKSTHASK